MQDYFYTINIIVNCNFLKSTAILQMYPSSSKYIIYLYLYNVHTTRTKFKKMLHKIFVIMYVL